ncbi:MAG TPA: S8 family serine peptidase [Steroidobacteraceae bacterium]|nr:S8 family serine peptidase [Steroidobacteraceae bacterium]
MSRYMWAVAASILVAAGVIVQAAEHNPVRTHSRSASAAVEQRVIVMMRGASASGSSQDRLTALAARAGIKLNKSRHLLGNMHALHVQPVNGESITATIARLRADPNVQFAEVDHWRYPHAVPNDPGYSGQWYLQNTKLSNGGYMTVSAVDAEEAWDTSTGGSTLGATAGDSGVVIADLDTGVRFEHPDLQWAGAGGRLLPGYDFISDKTIANDGDGRDADPSDPGDWVSAADAQQAPFKGADCIPAGKDHLDSSWHGTRTAGILGALTNSGTGTSGITWSGWILPVRVLGKCGGYDDDIMAGMLWAAGVHQDGVPDNPYPARIENMSLGSSGNACSAAYAKVAKTLTDLGVLVVVSAGNESGPVDEPANCTGFAAVAGLRQAGTKVGYSSFGPEVALSAPAGNCINLSGACLFSIDTTVNDGTTVPGSNVYTDKLNITNVGTSFSAPIVSGIAGLMLAVNGNLNSAQLISRLQEGAKKPFPTVSDTGTPAVCDNNNPTDNECSCTVTTCGAGMANAKGAVTAALRPIAAVAVSPSSFTSGQTVTLDASGSAAACGRTVVSYQWAGSGGHTVSASGTNGSTGSVVANGSFTVTLTITDDQGATDTATVAVTTSSATPATAVPSNAGSTACLAKVNVASPVTVSLSPGSASLMIGSGSQNFTATVGHTLNTAVTWEVNGVAGGNATVGTISTSGAYAAPTTAPSGGSVTVAAVSVADPNKSATAQVTINTPKSGGGALDWATVLTCGLALATAMARRGRREPRASRAVSLYSRR